MVAIGLVRPHRARKAPCAPQSPYVADSALFCCPLPGDHPLAACSTNSLFHAIVELDTAHLIPPTTLGGKYYDAYFKDKENEAERLK